MQACRALSVDSLLANFEQILRIDLGLMQRTIEKHMLYIRRYLEFCKERNLSIESPSSIRQFLLPIREGNANTYGNNVKSLRVFFREYLKSNAAESFKIPRSSQGYVKVPTREELRRFYDALPSWKMKALFLMYASSGRRRNEILDLKQEDVDWERRMLRPNYNDSRTKHTWFSFFNEEALEAYRKYQAEEGNKSGGKLFGSAAHLNHVFKRASEITKVRITPQVLREWFCQAMGELGVPDRYVDAFCGRVPKSVLARHYTDFNPERLKEIYNKANLKVLS